MKRLLPVLMVFGMLLFGAGEGFALPPCPENGFGTIVHAPKPLMTAQHLLAIGGKISPTVMTLTPIRMAPDRLENGRIKNGTE